MRLAKDLQEPAKMMASGYLNSAGLSQTSCKPLVTLLQVDLCKLINAVSSKKLTILLKLTKNNWNN